MMNDYDDNGSSLTTNQTARLNQQQNANVLLASSIGRIALSKNACRFELPMDMKQLESMTPADYLSKYCRIIDRRKTLYRRVFEKYKLKAEKEDYVDLRLLEDCLLDVHMKSISKEQIGQIINLACLNQLPPPIQINFALFCGLSALSGILLFQLFVFKRFLLSFDLKLLFFFKERILYQDFV